MNTFDKTLEWMQHYRYDEFMCGLDAMWAMIFIGFGATVGLLLSFTFLGLGAGCSIGAMLYFKAKLWYMHVRRMKDDDRRVKSFHNNVV